MKKRLFSLLLLPLMLIGCASNGANSDKGSYQHNSINKAVHTGEIADFKLTGPENGFVTDTGFTFKLKSLVLYHLSLMMKMKSM